MKIKYVGVKEDGETAFASAAGIAKWMPGDSFEIANPQLASRMLQHPDVFAEDTSTTKASKSTSTPVAAGVLAPGASITLAPGGAVDPLAGMDDKQVRAFAKNEGFEIRGLNLLKGDNLRAKVKAAQAEKK